jgi:hypothetical protein
VGSVPKSVAMAALNACWAREGRRIPNDPFVLYVIQIAHQLVSGKIKSAFVIHCIPVRGPARSFPIKITLADYEIATGQIQDTFRDNCNKRMVHTFPCQPRRVQKVIPSAGIDPGVMLIPENLRTESCIMRISPDRKESNYRVCKTF